MEIFKMKIGEKAMRKAMLFIGLLTAAVLMAVNFAAAQNWKYNENESISPATTAQTLVDEVSDTLTYIGRAKAGALTSAPVWQIMRLYINGTITAIQFYNGDASYNAIWDDRADATYE